MLTSAKLSYIKKIYVVLFKELWLLKLTFIPGRILISKFIKTTFLIQINK